MGDIFVFAVDWWERNINERANVEFFIGLLPSIGAGLALYLILRWISRADRTERAAKQEIEKDAEAWYESVKNSKGTKDPFGTGKEK